MHLPGHHSIDYVLGRSINESTGAGAYVCRLATPLYDTGSESLADMLIAVSTDPDSEVRRFVDLANGQHCVTAERSLYDLGILSRFTVRKILPDVVLAQY